MNMRERRREKREDEFGPEKLIVSTQCNQHTLECGHVVEIHATERHNIKRRRCIHCRNKQS